MIDSYQQLEKLFTDTYLVVDKGFLKLVCATIIANRLPLDPVWLFLVAPPSAGKTEIIQALDKVTGVYPISTITANTFISGFKSKGKETSLLHMIKEGIITFKDFTSILTLHTDERKEIIGQLREIYDGSYTKHFGTGDKISWKGKIGMVSGVTTVIHVVREMFAAMGERFIMYSLEMPDAEAMTKLALDNDFKIRSRREEIKDAFAHYLDTCIKMPRETFSIDTELRDELVEIAFFSSNARAVVERDYRSASKDITFVHPPESPARFAKQLKSLAIAFIIMNETKILSELDKHILFKIALDSMPPTRRKALQELGRYQTITTPALAVKAKYPTQTVKRWLEDLAAIGMVDRVKDGGKADKWRIKDRYRTIIKKFDAITELNYDLTEANSEDDDAEIKEQPPLLLDDDLAAY